jgi:hypothetical protein
MLEDYVITCQGVDYVLYPGLLAEAHRREIKELRLELVQLPTSANGWRAICQAQVTTASGRFMSLGEACPANAGSDAIATLLHLAQIRAKAHAMCDALNLDLTPIEDRPGGSLEGS